MKKLKSATQKKTPQEILRENQRSLNRAIRDLDREKAKLDQQEKKIVNDIKAMAKDGQNDAVRVMAKDLVRTRKAAQKITIMKANIQAVSLRITTLKTQGDMSNAMQGVTKAMTQMNKQMQMPAIQKIMMEFDKQNEMMNMKGEMMDDMIDDAMAGSDDDEEEGDAIVSQIFEDLGIQMGEALGGVPTAPLPGTSRSVTQQTARQDADLEARLNNLRRD